MKPFSPFFRLLITASGIFPLTIGPVFSGEEHIVKNRQVRVTTGIGSVQGWEQGLIQKNPNLSRWHWDPIYYYKQGYGPVRQKSSQIDGGRPTGKQTSGPSNSSYPPNTWHDTKPIHIPYSPQAMAELNGRLSIPKKPSDNPLADKETVLGKLMDQPPGTESIATYGKILPQRKSSLNTALKYGSQTTNVYGRVLNQKTVHNNHNSQSIDVYGQLLNQKTLHNTSRGGNGPKKNK